MAYQPGPDEGPGAQVAEATSQHRPARNVWLGRLSTYIVSFAGGLTFNDLSARLGYHWLAGAVALSGVVTAAVWIRGLDSRARATRYAPPLFLLPAGCAAGLAAFISGSTASLLTLAAAVLTVAAVLATKELQSAARLLLGAAAIAVGAPFIADRAMVAGAVVIAVGVVLCAFGVALIAAGTEFIAAPVVLFGTTVITGGAALIAFLGIVHRVRDRGHRVARRRRAQLICTLVGWDPQFLHQLGLASVVDQEQPAALRITRMPRIAT